MSKYSKLIGMVIGVVLGALVNFGLISADVDIGGLQNAILVVMSAIGVYVAPAND